jgi:hypothetical protein
VRETRERVAERRGERKGRLCSEHTCELIENFQAFLSSPHIIALLLLEYSLRLSLYLRPKPTL